MQFITRAYNSISLSEDKKILTKYSNTDRFYDEINYYKYIPDDVANYFPVIFSSDTSNIPYSLSMNYYATANDLGKLMCYHDSDSHQWVHIRDELLAILQKIHSHNMLDSVISDAPYRDIYIKKTNDEFYSLLKNPVFFDLNKYPTLNINGKNYRNYSAISDEVNSLIFSLLFSNVKYTMIHGDMCFGNILYRGFNENMILIDPRGSWGIKGIYGDPKYDMAKLYHSFHGCYEYIVNDLFSLRYDKNIISFEYANDNYKKIFDIFSECILDDKSYKLIEGLIYIGMCARHYDSLPRQIVMYCTGIQILNEVLENI